VIRRCAAFVNAHIGPDYAALSKTPHALADGLMLVFEHPVEGLTTSKKTGPREKGGVDRFTWWETK
jgi:hypothetical protein